METLEGSSLEEQIQLKAAALVGSQQGSEVVPGTGVARQGHRGGPPGARAETQPPRLPNSAPLPRSYCRGLHTKGLWGLLQVLLSTQALHKQNKLVSRALWELGAARRTPSDATALCGRTRPTFCRADICQLPWFPFGYQLPVVSSFPASAFSFLTGTLSFPLQFSFCRSHNTNQGTPTRNGKIMALYTPHGLYTASKYLSGHNFPFLV